MKVLNPLPTQLPADVHAGRQRIMSQVLYSLSPFRETEFLPPRLKPSLAMAIAGS